MENLNTFWLEQLVAALADALAALACYGVDDPALVRRIEEALSNAERLKRCSLRP